MISNRNVYATLLLATISSVALLGVTTNIGQAFAAKYSATLSGNDEVPPVNTDAGGKATFRTGDNNATIKYKVNITGLSEATGAHIHMGKTGENGDVVVDLLKDAKNNPTKAGMALRGNITDSSLAGPLQGKTVGDLLSAMESGDTYTNIHTTDNPDGVIRGQIERNAPASADTTSSMSTSSADNTTESG